jgi:8-oxo-dGTP pyrophosphatase MutT (NUDIX family)
VTGLLALSIPSVGFIPEMLELGDQATPILPAATVVMLRDGANGMEALLVQRSKAVKHMGGMWVFPGGKVDEADYPADREPFGAALNAAIRETREEAGLTIGADQLVYLSHWTTPQGAKKRFSTWFFLAILEDDQEVEVDGGEIADHRWVTPDQAFAELHDESHPFRLMPPTYVSLVDIAPYGSCDQARAVLDERDAIMYAPRMVFVDGGICFLYQGDAGYENEQLDTAGTRHSTHMVNDQLDYVRE